MTDAQFFGVIGLLLISAMTIGFVIGYAANPTDSHDD